MTSRWLSGFQATALNGYRHISPIKITNALTHIHERGIDCLINDARKRALVTSDKVTERINLLVHDPTSLDPKDQPAAFDIHFKARHLRVFRNIRADAF